MKHVTGGTHLKGEVQMKKVMFMFCIPLILLAACQSTPKPEEVVLAQVTPWNAGDVETALALYTDDVVVKFEPALPPGSPEQYSGKVELRAWFEELAAMNFEMQIEVIQVDGDTVTTKTQTWVDPTRELGVAPLVATEVFIVRDGKIKAWTWTLSEDSLAALQTALAEVPAPKTSIITVEDLVGTWEWDRSITLYLQFNADGTYRMHANPWPHESGQSAQDALAQNPGDLGKYKLEGNLLTMESSEATVVCEAGDITEILTRITDDGKLELALQSEDCSVRRPPSKSEYMSRVAP
jgi:hypothetical protein